MFDKIIKLLTGAAETTQEAHGEAKQLASEALALLGDVKRARALVGGARQTFTMTWGAVTSGAPRNGRRAPKQIN